MIVLLDANGIQSYVSESCERILGYKPEELINTSVIEEMIHQDDQAQFIAGLADILENSNYGGAQYRHRHKKGSWVYLEAFGTNQIHNPLINSVVLNVRDITKRKKAEKSNIRGKQQHDNLMANIPIGVYVLHSKPEGTFALDYVSPRMAEILDLSAEALYADVQVLYKRIHPDDLDGFLRSNQEGIAQKRPFDWQGRVIINETVKWLQITSIPQDIESGDVLWNGIIVDITKRKQAEQALAESDSIRELLLDIITHDLKNPAGNIYALSEAAQQDMPENKFLEAIYTSSGRLIEVLAQTTILSQATFGETIPKETLSLNKLLQETADEFASALSIAEMDLVVDIAPDVIIDANPLIAEVFKNYISNAIKHTRDGKRIVIETAIEDQAVVVCVKDFGKTLAKADREQIFERRAQLEEGKKRGRGLGLAIAKRIAIAHGGEVWVEPNTPVGNSFCLRIPF